MPRARAPIIVAALVMVVWGASPAMTKIAARDLTSLEVGVLRTLLAGLVAAPIVLVTRERLPTGGHQRRLLLVSAISGFVAFPILYSVGQGRTSAMHGGMILAALPIFTGAYAAILDRRRPSRAWVAGSALALAGEVALVTIRTGDGGAGATRARRRARRALGDAGLGRLRGRARASARAATARWPRPTGASSSARCWCCPCSPAPSAPTACPRPALESWAAIRRMAVVTSIVGYIGWYWALARGGIQRISTIQFLQPFSGLLIAAWLLGEQFTLPLIAASAMILAGVAITQRR